MAVWALFAHWVPYVVGARTAIVVAMDWTDFDPDGQATIMLSLLTRHGRATPLVWLTVDKATLKEHRNDYEDQVLIRLSEVLPKGVGVLMVADRGFGDQKQLPRPLEGVAEIQANWLLGLHHRLQLGLLQLK